MALAQADADVSGAGVETSGVTSDRPPLLFVPGAVFAAGSSSFVSDRALRCP
jgi:hypothetical protein